MQPVKLKIYDKGQPVAEFPIEGVIKLGRQDQGQRGPYQREGDKVIIASSQHKGISRNQASIELRDGEFVLVSNLSASVPIETDQGPILRREDGPRRFQLPLLLTIGDRACRLEQEEPLTEGLQSLDEVTLPPGSEVERVPLQDLMASGGGLDHAELVRWFRSASSVFQSAATSSNFFGQAVQSVATLVSLDYAKVLTRNGDSWVTEASYPSDFEHSDTIVKEVCREKRTFRRMPCTDLGSGRPISLEQVSALVAAPILNRDAEVIAVLYGDRRRMHNNRIEISELEAMLVEMLACGVAGGIARLEEEQNALEARVQFEQFFTPQLARQLESEPTLLDGREAEISILFCDISRLQPNQPRDRTPRNGGVDQ